MSDEMAWVVEGGFGRDRLQRVKRPVRAPGPGEVRLRVRAVSLNYRDLLMIEGHYDPRQPLPLVPCSDGVGVVEAVGAGVAEAWLGVRAMPSFATTWLAGPLPVDARAGTLGGPLDGCLSETVTVPAACLVAVPDALTDEEAATLPCAGVTAWHALEAAGVGPGDRVLTLGTGGVSMFALQLARLRGAEVAITSGSAHKLARAADLGASFGVRHDLETAWARAVRGWAPAGVDAVIEVGGAGTFDQSVRAVRPGGTVALIGVLAGGRAPVDLARVLMQGVTVQGIFVGARAHLAALVRALEAHPDTRPVIDRVFPFDAAHDAFAYLASGAHIGKVVVRAPS